MIKSSLSDYPSFFSRQGLNQWKIESEIWLDQQFEQGISIQELLILRTKVTDELLRELWQQATLNQETQIQLFATGGYGRQELLPYSDIDIMILSSSPLSKNQEQHISTFVASLWDIKHLKPGISVRTLEECIEECTHDITIATSLIEARQLIGSIDDTRLPRKIVLDTWTDFNFYKAKCKEQKQRYAQHNDTESNLEPDIKNAPGGIRDIHQIGWITKRHFRVNRIYDLVHLGFLSEFELQQLEKAENFYWTVRHHLHKLTQRDENRLLFDYQRDIAERMGFLAQEQQAPNNHIEKFMRRYYCFAQQISTLNHILLSYFNESVILPALPNYQKHTQKIDAHFKVVDHKIAVQHHHVFSEYPETLLELFYLLATYPNIQGIRARTLRLLVLSAKKIDLNFRENKNNQDCFMRILRDAPDIYFILSEMKRYGVLGHYIPAFGQVVGLMQYDLFHIYTVDQHTLLLLRNLGRFKDPEFAKDFPIVSSVYQRLKRRDIVIMAALFHDIAKGRGGDHSELGASDARIFCAQHGFTIDECNIVAWLVENHLLMSLTAQKKDISDPDIIQQFAQKVKDLTHLDYLYTLTVADINATNPKLWNTWRASLMRQLYTQTRDVIRLGVDRDVNYQVLIEDKKFHASEYLVHTFALQHVEHVWNMLGDHYFLKESADEIAWHTKAILEHQDVQTPLILIREQRKQAQDAAQIFIYTHDKPNLFATTVAVLDRMNLDVQDARITTSNTGFSLDTYVVLDRFGTLVKDKTRQDEVKTALMSALSDLEQYPKLMQRRIPRQLKHFNIQNKVTISYDNALQQNLIEISALDYPGLLAKIGEFFMLQQLDIHSAKIATLGERAEDLFFVTKKNGQTLTEIEILNLTEQFTLVLDEASNVVTK